MAISITKDLGRSERAGGASDSSPAGNALQEAGKPSPQPAVPAKEDLSLLFQAISQLSPKCQQVFLLSRVRQMTYTEIAQHCGISVKMVEIYITQALTICLKKAGRA